MDAIGPLISPLLVGRDDLVELAARRLDEAAAGRGQFLLVAGETGIGKSRFVEAIRDVAEERGFRSVGGWLAPQDRDVPAASILDLARSAARNPAFGALGPDLLGRREATATTEHTRRRALVVDIVERIRQDLDRPTVLVFEDLQWADDLSLEIIAELARTNRDRPLLMVGDYRSDEALPGASLREWRSRLLTQRLVEEIRLGPLDRAQTALVTTLILDTGLPAPREVVDAVYDRTDGIPLHIEELLGAMSAQARADGRAIREATVPETIEDAVLERLGRRSVEAQAVARAGAVIGRCFVPDVLAGIMDQPVESLDEPLQELIENGVIDPPGLRGLIDFRHQLLRDAIYRSVPLRDLRRLHARAGEFGAQLEGHSEIHASLHYERAGLRQQAFDAAMAGAREAASLSAHREAFELYRRALDNQPSGLAPLDRAELLESVAGEAAAIEEVGLAEAWADEAALAFREAGEPVRAIVAAELVLVMWRRNGTPVSQRVRLARRLLAELDTLPVTADTVEARGDLNYYLALAFIDGSDTVAAREPLAIARACAAEASSSTLASAADSVGALIDFIERTPTVAVERLAEVAAAGEASGDEFATLAAFRDASTLAVRSFDYPTAARLIDAGLRYADTVEQSHCAHVMTANSAMVDWATGAWDDATRSARQALVDRGCERGASVARWTLGYVALGHGDLAAAEAELRPALAFGEHSEEPDLIVSPAWGLAEAELLGGEPERAADRCRAAFERIAAVADRSLLVPFLVTGTRALIAAGQPTAAATWVDGCAELLATTPSPVAPTALAHARGLVALANGSTGLARTELTQAARGWDSFGRTWEGSWARSDLASAHLRAGRYADAARLGLEVRTVASRLDSRPLADAADAIARMARGHVIVDQPWHPLTAREFEVARLVSEGRTNAEIAEALGIAPKTASAHVEHILAKLGASRRAEIASWTSSVAMAVAR